MQNRDREHQKRKNRSPLVFDYYSFTRFSEFHRKIPLKMLRRRRLPLVSNRRPVRRACRQKDLLTFDNYLLAFSLKVCQGPALRVDPVKISFAVFPFLYA